MHRVLAWTVILLAVPPAMAQADAADVPVAFTLEHVLDTREFDERSCDEGPCGEGNEDQYCGGPWTAPAQGGVAFTFQESAEATGCAQVQVAIPVPPGSDRVTLRFWADRTISYTDPVVGQATELDARQDVLAFTSGTASSPDRASVFDAGSPSMPDQEHEATFSLGTLGDQGGELVLGWLFSDRGPAGSQRIPALGAAMEFSSTVHDIGIEIQGTSPETAQARDVERRQEDGRTFEHFTLALPLPDYPTPPNLGNITSTLTFDLEAQQVDQVIGPGQGGSRVVLPLDVISTDEDAYPARVWITQEFDVMPSGAYEIAAVYEIPRPATDVSWLPALVLGLPLVAGAFASRNVHLYRRQARGPYIRTGRALTIVIAVAWTVYVALATIALFVVGWTRLQVLPPDAITVLVYVQVAVVVLGFLLIWHLAGRSYVEAMRVDLARRDSQAEELRRSNEELERFAYVASHDLQEPLRKVAASTMMIRKRYGGQLDEGGDKWIDYAVDGAHRMQAMVQSLLTYSRAGQGELERTDVDLEGLVQEIVSDLENAIEERDAEVTTGDLPHVWADRLGLRQVLQNIVQNGLKYQEEGKRPVLHIEAADADGGVEITVADNGIGMPPDKTDRIFEPFQRLHRREVYEGTGIGLAICARIVERHNGRIWVESKEGKGSTFHVWLPAEGDT